MNNPPAFPVTTGSDGGCLHEGMTLRDYFAAKALQGMCIPNYDIPTISPERAAKDSYDYADAMLKEREKQV